MIGLPGAKLSSVVGETRTRDLLITSPTLVSHWTTDPRTLQR